jgi:hypothetical protein
LAGLGTAIAGLFYDGGVAGKKGPTAVVPSSIFKGAARLQNGGVPGAGRDTIPALLTPGERVLNLRESRAFEAGAKRGASTTVIAPNFNFPEGTDAQSFLESQDQIAATTSATLRRAEGRNS